MPAYAELHALSNFTFLRGASHPEELVESAAELGYTALAITDECSVSGIVRAHVAAKNCGLEKLIIGSEIRLDNGLKLVVLAQNRAGYARLCRLISDGRRAAEKGSYKLTADAFSDGLPDCLLLWIPEDNHCKLERTAGYAMPFVSACGLPWNYSQMAWSTSAWSSCCG